MRLTWQLDLDATLSRTTLIFSIVILTTCFLIMPLSVHAGGDCDSVLKEGVFDRSQVRQKSYSSMIVAWQLPQLTASSELLNAWSNCMLGQKGVAAVLEVQDDRNLVYTVKYGPISNGLVSSTITSGPAISGGAATNPEELALLRTGKKILIGGTSVHIRRNSPTEPGSISINTDSGPSNRYPGKVVSAPAFPTQISGTHNLVGHWIMHHMYKGKTYQHDMFFTLQENQTITGNGGYPAGKQYSYAWKIESGLVTQNRIMLTVRYTAGITGTTMHMEGNISQDGTRIEDGKWDDNYGGQTRVGTWTAIKD